METEDSERDTVDSRRMIPTMEKNHLYMSVLKTFA